MVDIPFPSSTNPGAAPGEGSGRLVNCYAYKDGDASRWKPLPGLLPFASVPDGEARGAMVFNGLLIVVVGHSVAQVNAGGTYELLEGQVSGDGPVTIARNNNVIPNITITSSYGSSVLSGGVVQNYPDANLPVANSVTFLDGYFLWTTPGGDIIASGLNSTTIDPLSKARAESKPDGLLRGVVYGQQFFAFGEDTIEVWQDAGATPFPLTRLTVIPTGLIGPWAVAGFETGWAGPLIFVAQDGSVRSLSDFTPTRISSEDLERKITAVSDKRQLRAGVYTFGGNLIWSLSGPDWTWEYNVTTGSWHERESYGQSGWRAALTVNAFNRWLAADRDGGQFYAIDAGTRAEGDDPLIWGLDAGPVKQFPSRIQVPGAAFDFVLGQTASFDTAPEVMLSWSHDGGGRWANPVTRSLGRQGIYAGRVSINRVGLSTSSGIRWRFRVSDPVYSSFAGGRMDAVDRK